MTHSLINALMLVDVQILDHLVVSAESIVSMAQRGLLQNP
ncbi:MAG: JAB domain-containing protein [Paraclostridium sp.]